MSLLHTDVALLRVIQTLKKPQTVWACSRALKEPLRAVRAWLKHLQVGGLVWKAGMSYPKGRGRPSQLYCSDKAVAEYCVNEWEEYDAALDAERDSLVCPALARGAGNGVGEVCRAAFGGFSVPHTIIEAHQGLALERYGLWCPSLSAFTKEVRTAVAEGHMWLAGVQRPYIGGHQMKARTKGRPAQLYCSDRHTAALALLTWASARWEAAGCPES